MTYLASEYAGISVLISASVLLGALLVGLSFLVSRSRTADSEKLSAYECGFDPFEDSRSEFGAHFYLLGILFVVFDLEVILLFPWAVSVGGLGPVAVWAALDFLVELALGFVFAWAIGALEV